MTKLTIQERLKILRDKVRSGELKQGGGLGNEVNYHIFDYDPSDELLVGKEVENLQGHKKGRHSFSYWNRPVLSDY